MSRGLRPLRVGLAGGLLLMGMAPAAHALSLLAIAVPDSYSTPFETRLRVDDPGVLGNDVSVGNGRPEVTNDVDHGNLNLDNDGSFDYTPDDGFSGTDHFVYRLTRVAVGLPDHATVTITIGPAPTPTPTPKPTPTPEPTPAPTPKPTPTPTPKPTPTPTPHPTPTPTPRPILPLPTIELPLPSLPQLLPTPRPSATPTPSPSATPTPTPESTTSPDPSPTAAASPTDVAGAGPVTPGDGGGGSGAAPASLAPPDPLAPWAVVAGEEAGAAPDVTVGLDTGGIGVEWLVPTVAVTVPGLLVMLAVLAQSLGALAWIPFVRRWLGDFGLFRRRRARDASGRA